MHHYTIPVSVILTTKDNPENKSNNNHNNNTILIIVIIVSFALTILIAIAIYICIFKKKNMDLKEEVLKASFKEEETE